MPMRVPAKKRRNTETGLFHQNSGNGSPEADPCHQEAGPPTHYRACHQCRGQQDQQRTSRNWLYVDSMYCATGETR